MFEETKRLESPTGASLAYHRASPAAPARAVLLVLHGLAEHSRRYARFANAMAARGFAVYAHDHRGHGETRAPDAPPGRFARREGVAAVLGDVAAMRRLAAAEHPGLPVLLLGHSMGGLISLNAAMAEPKGYDGVAVWNSNFDPGLAGRLAQLVLRGERMLKGSDVPSGILPKATFGAWGRAIAGRRTEFDWLSHDTAEVDRYIADPLCGFPASVSLWIDLFDMTFRPRQAARLAGLARTLPIHLVGGGQDPATNGGRAIVWLAKYLKQAGFSNISDQIYQDMRHETLNEIGAEAAIAAFADWCDGVTARR